MMKLFGGAVVVGYALLTFSGYEPFTPEQRGKLPADARRGPGGVLLWHTGFRGGK